MLVHTDERPFECRQCAKKFKSFPEVKQHIVVHTEERLFECVNCPKRKFKSRVVLTLHTRRVHTKEKPFECTKCSKKFKTNSDQHTCSFIPMRDLSNAANVRKGSK